LLVQAVWWRERPFQGSVDWSGELIRKLFYGSVAFVVLSAVAYAQQWQRLGPEGGMVISLAGGAGGNVYLGVSDGHVFGSDDAARHWELRGRVGTRTDAVVSRMVVDPRDAKRVFAAVWYQEAGAGGGVFKSEDAGRHWRLLGLKAEAVRALEIAPENPDMLVAGTRSGVFVSRDAGSTWSRITPEGDEELRNVDSLAIDPIDADIIYAGTYHLPWKTIDGGKTWRPASAGLIDDSDIMSVRVDAANPQRVFISACSGIYRSENQGEQWTKLQGIPYAARRTQQIVQDVENPAVLYAATTEGLWVTRDAGESWGRTTPGDWVINSVVVLPGATSGTERLVVGTEAQGILISQDAGETFAPSNTGFTHQIIRQLVGDPGNSRHILIALQRTGQELLESRDAGENWSALLIPVKSNAATWSALDVQEILGTTWGWLVQLKDGRVWICEEEKQLWKEWFPGVSSPGATGPAKIHSTMGQTTMGHSTIHTTMGAARRGFAPVRGKVAAHSSSKLYVAIANGVLGCDLAGTCASLRAFTKLENLGAVAVSQDGGRVFVIEGGKLGISEDGGETARWSDLPNPAMKVGSISIASQSQETVLYATTEEGLYVYDGAKDAWTLLRGGLPAGQMDVLIIAQKTFVTTLRSGEMYYAKNLGENWNRADGDAERGRFTGMVELAPGIALAGSQSEGVLKFEEKNNPQ
jgi:photosystem II stability/assembly factor-like uncharacterized protein